MCVETSSVEAAACGWRLAFLVGSGGKHCDAVACRRKMAADRVFNVLGPTVFPIAPSRNERQQSNQRAKRYKISRGLSTAQMSELQCGADLVD